VWTQRARERCDCGEDGGEQGPHSCYFGYTPNAKQWHEGTTFAETKTVQPYLPLDSLPPLDSAALDHSSLDALPRSRIAPPCRAGPGALRLESTSQPHALSPTSPARKARSPALARRLAWQLQRRSAQRAFCARGIPESGSFLPLFTLAKHSEDGACRPAAGSRS
jgi:hypothetical protein